MRTVLFFDENEEPKNWCKTQSSLSFVFSLSHAPKDLHTTGENAHFVTHNLKILEGFLLSLIYCPESKYKV